jgi:hypothetical protein
MLVTGAALVLVASRVGAHHAFSPVYDEKRTVTVEGVVTEFRFVNPHAMMSMDVSDKSGKVTKWVVEFAGRLNLSEVGWTVDSIKAGERVTVTGNPTHTESPRLFFRKLVRSDGSELLPAGPQRLDAIEEARKERARRRNQKSSGRRPPSRYEPRRRDDAIVREQWRVEVATGCDDQAVGRVPMKRRRECGRGGGDLGRDRDQANRPRMRGGRQPVEQRDVERQALQLHEHRHLPEADRR